MSGLELLIPEHRRLFIGGSWREANSGATFSVRDPADGSVRTQDGSTGYVYQSTLVYDETVRDRVVELRLTEEGRLSLLDSPTAAGRVAGLVRTAVRRHAGPARRADPLNLAGVPSRPASVEESARLAVLAARLLARPAGPDPTAVAVWATAALAVLCRDALQTHNVCRAFLHNKGWARYGLGASSAIGIPQNTSAMPNGTARRRRTRPNEANAPISPPTPSAAVM